MLPKRHPLLWLLSPNLYSHSPTIAAFENSGSISAGVIPNAFASRISVRKVTLRRPASQLLIYVRSSPAKFASPSWERPRSARRLLKWHPNSVHASVSLLIRQVHALVDYESTDYRSHFACQHSYCDL